MVTNCHVVNPSSFSPLFLIVLLKFILIRLRMFEKHGVKGVTIHNFVRSPPEGTLIKVRKNGDTLYYNPKTNIFDIKNADGTQITM